MPSKSEAIKSYIELGLTEAEAKKLVEEQERRAKVTAGNPLDDVLSTAAEDVRAKPLKPLTTNAEYSAKLLEYEAALAERYRKQPGLSEADAVDRAKRAASKMRALPEAARPSAEALEHAIAGDDLFGVKELPDVSGTAVPRGKSAPLTDKEKVQRQYREVTKSKEGSSVLDDLGDLWDTLFADEVALDPEYQEEAQQGWADLDRAPAATVLGKLAGAVSEHAVGGPDQTSETWIDEAFKAHRKGEPVSDIFYEALSTPEFWLGSGASFVEDLSDIEYAGLIAETDELGRAVRDEQGEVVLDSPVDLLGRAFTFTGDMVNMGVAPLREAYFEALYDEDAEELSSAAYMLGGVTSYMAGTLGTQDPEVAWKRIQESTFVPSVDNALTAVRTALIESEGDTSDKDVIGMAGSMQLGSAQSRVGVGVGVDLDDLKIWLQVTDGKVVDQLDPKGKLRGIVEMGEMDPERANELFSELTLAELPTPLWVTEDTAETIKRVSKSRWEARERFGGGHVASEFLGPLLHAAMHTEETDASGQTYLAPTALEKAMRLSGAAQGWWIEQDVVPLPMPLIGALDLRRMYRAGMTGGGGKMLLNSFAMPEASVEAFLTQDKNTFWGTGKASDFAAWATEEMGAAGYEPIRDFENSTFWSRYAGYMDIRNPIAASMMGLPVIAERLPQSFILGGGEDSLLYRMAGVVGAWQDFRTPWEEAVLHTVTAPLVVGMEAKAAMAGTPGFTDTRGKVSAAWAYTTSRDGLSAYHDAVVGSVLRQIDNGTFDVNEMSLMGEEAAKEVIEQLGLNWSDVTAKLADQVDQNRVRAAENLAEVAERPGRALKGSAEFKRVLEEIAVVGAERGLSDVQQLDVIGALATIAHVLADDPAVLDIESPEDVFSRVSFVAKEPSEVQDDLDPARFIIRTDAAKVPSPHDVDFFGQEAGGLVDAVGPGPVKTLVEMWEELQEFAVLLTDEDVAKAKAKRAHQRHLDRQQEQARVVRETLDEVSARVWLDPEHKLHEKAVAGRRVQQALSKAGLPHTPIDPEKAPPLPVGEVGEDWVPTARRIAAWAKTDKPLHKLPWAETKVSLDLIEPPEGPEGLALSGKLGTLSVAYEGKSFQVDLYWEDLPMPELAPHQIPSEQSAGRSLIVKPQSADLFDDRWGLAVMLEGIFRARREFSGRDPAYIANVEFDLENLAKPDRRKLRSLKLEGVRLAGAFADPVNPKSTILLGADAFEKLARDSSMRGQLERTATKIRRVSEAAEDPLSGHGFGGFGGGKGSKAQLQMSSMADGASLAKVRITKSVRAYLVHDPDADVWVVADVFKGSAHDASATDLADFGKKHNGAGFSKREGGAKPLSALGGTRNGRVADQLLTFTTTAEAGRDDLELTAQALDWQRTGGGPPEFNRPNMSRLEYDLRKSLQPSRGTKTKTKTPFSKMSREDRARWQVTADPDEFGTVAIKKVLGSIRGRSFQRSQVDIRNTGIEKVLSDLAEQGQTEIEVSDLLSIVRERLPILTVRPIDGAFYAPYVTPGTRAEGHEILLGTIEPFAEMDKKYAYFDPKLTLAEFKRLVRDQLGDEVADAYDGLLPSDFRGVWLRPGKELVLGADGLPSRSKHARPEDAVDVAMANTHFGGRVTPDQSHLNLAREPQAFHIRGWWERDPETGEKVYVLHEVQSDWASRQFHLGPLGYEPGSSVDRLMKHPLRQRWTDIAIRRAIQAAVARGATGIKLSSGAEVAGSLRGDSTPLSGMPHEIKGVTFTRDGAKFYVDSVAREGGEEPVGSQWMPNLEASHIFSPKLAVKLVEVAETGVSATVANLELTRLDDGRIKAVPTHPLGLLIRGDAENIKRYDREYITAMERAVVDMNEFLDAHGTGVQLSKPGRRDAGGAFLHIPPEARAAIDATNVVDYSVVTDPTEVAEALVTAKSRPYMYSVLRRSILDKFGAEAAPTADKLAAFLTGRPASDFSDLGMKPPPDSAEAYGEILKAVKKFEGTMGRAAKRLPEIAKQLQTDLVDDPSTATTPGDAIALTLSEVDRLATKASESSLSKNAKKKLVGELRGYKSASVGSEKALAGLVSKHAASLDMETAEALRSAVGDAGLKAEVPDPTEGADPRAEYNEKLTTALVANLAWLREVAVQQLLPQVPGEEPSVSPPAGVKMDEILSSDVLHLLSTQYEMVDGKMVPLEVPIIRLLAELRSRDRQFATRVASSSGSAVKPFTELAAGARLQSPDFADPGQITLRDAQEEIALRYSSDGEFTSENHVRGTSQYGEDSSYWGIPVDALSEAGVTSPAFRDWFLADVTVDPVEGTTRRQFLRSGLKLRERVFWQSLKKAGRNGGANAFLELVVADPEVKARLLEALRYGVTDTERGWIDWVEKALTDMQPLPPEAAVREFPTEAWHQNWAPTGNAGYTGSIWPPAFNNPSPGRAWVVSLKDGWSPYAAWKGRYSTHSSAHLVSLEQLTDAVGGDLESAYGTYGAMYLRRRATASTLWVFGEGPSASATWMPALDGVGPLLFESADQANAAAALVRVDDRDSFAEMTRPINKLHYKYDGEFDARHVAHSRGGPIKVGLPDGSSVDAMLLSEVQSDTFQSLKHWRRGKGLKKKQSRAPLTEPELGAMNTALGRQGSDYWGRTTEAEAARQALEMAYFREWVRVTSILVAEAAIEEGYRWIATSGPWGPGTASFAAKGILEHVSIEPGTGTYEARHGESSYSLDKNLDASRLETRTKRGRKGIEHFYGPEAVEAFGVARYLASETVSFRAGDDGPSPGEAKLAAWAGAADTATQGVYDFTQQFLAAAADLDSAVVTDLPPQWQALLGATGARAVRLYPHLGPRNLAWAGDARPHARTFDLTLDPDGGGTPLGTFALAAYYKRNSFLLTLAMSPAAWTDLDGARAPYNRPVKMGETPEGDVIVAVDVGIDSGGEWIMGSYTAATETASWLTTTGLEDVQKGRQESVVTAVDEARAQAATVLGEDVHNRGLSIVRVNEGDSAHSQRAVRDTYATQLPAAVSELIGAKPTHGIPAGGSGDFSPLLQVGVTSLAQMSDLISWLRLSPEARAEEAAKADTWHLTPQIQTVVARLYDSYTGEFKEVPTTLNDLPLLRADRAIVADTIINGTKEVEALAVELGMSESAIRAVIDYINSNRDLRRSREVSPEQAARFLQRIAERNPSLDLETDNVSGFVALHAHARAKTDLDAIIIQHGTGPVAQAAVELLLAHGVNRNTPRAAIDILTSLLADPNLNQRSDAMRSVLAYVEATYHPDHTPPPFDLATDVEAPLASIGDDALRERPGLLFESIATENPQLGIWLAKQVGGEMTFDRVTGGLGEVMLWEVTDEVREAYFNRKTIDLGPEQPAGTLPTPAPSSARLSAQQLADLQTLQAAVGVANKALKDAQRKGVGVDREVELYRKLADAKKAVTKAKEGQRSSRAVEDPHPMRGPGGVVEKAGRQIPLFQLEYGATFTLDDLRLLVAVARKGDLQTLLHELGHVFHILMGPEWEAAAARVFNSPEDSDYVEGMTNLTRDPRVVNGKVVYGGGRERFANGFPQWVRTGLASSGQRANLYRKAQSKLRRVQALRKSFSWSETGLLDGLYTIIGKKPPEGIDPAIRQNPRTRDPLENPAADRFFDGWLRPDQYLKRQAEMVTIGDRETTKSRFPGAIVGDVVTVGKGREAARAEVRRDVILAEMGGGAQPAEPHRLPGLGLRPGEKLGVDEAVARAIAFTAVQQVRQKFSDIETVSMTLRTVVPVARAQHIYDSMDEAFRTVAGFAIRDINKSMVEDGGDGIVLTPQQQAGVANLASLLAREPLGQGVDRRLLEPDSDLSTITSDELRSLRDAYIDINAGIGGHRARRAEKIPHSVGEAMWAAVKGLANGLAGKDRYRLVDEVVHQIRTTFDTSYGSPDDYLAPEVAEVIRETRRELAQAHSDVLRHINAFYAAAKGGPRPDIREMYSSLLDVLTPPASPPVKDALLGYLAALANSKKGASHLLRPGVAGELTSIFDEMGGLSSEEARALAALEAHRRAEDGIPDEVLADALRVIEAGLERRYTAMEMRAKALALAVAGSDDANVLVGLQISDYFTLPEDAWRDVGGRRAMAPSKGLYDLFYGGDWGGVFAWAENRGLSTAGVGEMAQAKTAGDRAKAVKAAVRDIRYDPATRLLEMFVRLRALEIMESFPKKLARLGLPVEQGALTERFGLKSGDPLWSPDDSDPVTFGTGGAIDRSEYYRRVLHYIRLATSWKDKLLINKSRRGILSRPHAPQSGRIRKDSPGYAGVEPGESSASFPEYKKAPRWWPRDNFNRVHDMQAYTDAMSILGRWGFKLGKGADWVIYTFPDGTQAHVPQMVVEQLDDAMSQVARVGTKYDSAQVSARELGDTVGTSLAGPPSSEPRPLHGRRKRARRRKSLQNGLRRARLTEPGTSAPLQKDKEYSAADVLMGGDFSDPADANLAVLLAGVLDASGTRFVFTEDLVPYAPSTDPIEAVKIVPGLFNQETNVIALRYTADPWLLLHESTHAAVRTWVNDVTVDEHPESARLLNRLTEIYYHVQAESKGAGFYGLTSMDEFLAEAFSNRHFQRHLDRMPSPEAGSVGDPPTIWTRFVDTLREILGRMVGRQPERSVLQDVLETGAELFEHGAEPQEGHFSVYGHMDDVLGEGTLFAEPGETGGRGVGPSIGGGIAAVVETLWNLFPLTPAKIKMGVTVGPIIPNPAYFLVNAIGMIWQTYQRAGLATVARATFRHPVFAGAVAKRLWGMGERGPGAYIITESYGPLSADAVADMARSHGLSSSHITAEAGRSLAREVRAMSGGFWRQMMEAPERWQGLLMEFAQAIDNYWRIGIFVDGLKEGRSAQDAAARARDAGFDYSDLTDREKVILRNTIIFYSFAKKNAELFWQTAVNNPSRLMGQLRLAKGVNETMFSNEEELIVEDYYRLRPFLAAAKSEMNALSGGYVGHISPNFPIGDAVQLHLDILQVLTDEDAQRGLASRIGPWIAWLPVFATNTDLFFGKDLDSWNIVDPWFVEWDRAITGGMIVDSILDVRVEHSDDPSRWPSPETPWVYRTYNGKSWWAVKNLLSGVPGMGRNYSTVQSLERADEPVSEFLREGAMALREGEPAVAHYWLTQGGPLVWWWDVTPMTTPPQIDFQGGDSFTHRPGISRAQEAWGIAGIRPVLLKDPQVKASRLRDEGMREMEEEIRRGERQSVFGE